MLGQTLGIFGPIRPLDFAAGLAYPRPVPSVQAG
jgi:hypothetical protein